MGPAASTEMKELFIRKTPIYFRGMLGSVGIDELLNMRLPSGSHIRELIRHVRIYVRCDEPTLAADNIKAKKQNTESQSYAQLSAQLGPLHCIDYAARKIKLEICILAPQATVSCGALNCMTYNILQAVKTVYEDVKSAGANLSVRLERYSDGIDADVTRVLDCMDRFSTSKEVCNCTLPLNIN
jgi:hypothetical protein